MLGKIFAFLSPTPKRKGPRFLDNDDANKSPAKQKKTVKQEFSVMEMMEKQYNDLTQAEITEAGDFFDKKDFRFYDFLLGKSKSDGNVNDLEKKILMDTNKMLNRPDVIADNLPQLPQSITQLKTMLDGKDFKLDEFSKIVQQEPALASHMVKVANSPMYNQSGKEISNLGHAFMMIGAEGVKEHILIRFFKQLLNIRPIYFKLFGEKIWEHSLSTAMIAKTLAQANGQDKETAYLNGLVHDIGKIMIFQLMVNAFRSANPDDSPNSKVFKKLLNEKSMKISLLVVKQWKMPEAIVNSIHDLALTHTRPAKTKMGKTLYEANLLSELGVMHNMQQLSPEQYLEIAKQAQLSDAAVNVLYQTVIANSDS